MHLGLRDRRPHIFLARCVGSSPWDLVSTIPTGHPPPVHLSTSQRLQAEPQAQGRPTCKQVLRTCWRTWGKSPGRLNRLIRLQNPAPVAGTRQSCEKYKFAMAYEPETRQRIMAGLPLAGSMPPESNLTLPAGA